MRLLDRVAQCRTPLRLALQGNPGRGFDVTGPSDYAALLSQCPHRYVLGDDVTQASAALAFADGARLVGCLDLLRVPAPLLWIEWNDAVHLRAIRDAGFATRDGVCGSERQVGALLRATPDGREAQLRTFWADASSAGTGGATLSPVETLIDLHGSFGDQGASRPFTGGGLLQPTDDVNEALATLLDHVRFRLDERWAGYYRALGATAATERALVEASVASVAWDAPLVLAFLLLQSANDAIRVVPVSRDAVNRKRRCRGAPMLLDHLEVHESLNARGSFGSAGAGAAGRQSPRLHHVRGHLVRRDNSVFWRTAHLRGSAQRGTIRSRTVRLSFGRRS